MKNLKKWLVALKGSPEAEAYHPDQQEHSARILYMERNVGLPVKAAVILVLFYYLFFSNWFGDVTGPMDMTSDTPPRETALESIRSFFLLYFVLNAAAACLLLGSEQFPLRWSQRVVFTIGWVDGLFLGALTLVTGGFDSILYWAFLGLIVRNAVSNRVASRQISLNLIVSFCYLMAGVADIVIKNWESDLLDDITRAAIMQGPGENATEPFVLRLALLLLMTVCCYGLQVLLDKQRRTELEAHEAALRQDQLEATGRLAAEIAHQLKNPLGIINNAAFSLQRTLKEGKTITQQIQIIREEVERSDRIITELMGYARLSEGQVEKINIHEALDQALERVFPLGAAYEVKVHRDYALALPPLLIQKAHISEVFVNILQNAREAMDGRGNIWVKAKYAQDFTVRVEIRDDGPGIPAEKISQVFEPYFTTKEKGTGLGLAIVKHNTELYGGTVVVDSELGKGTCFTIMLPANSLIKIRK